MLKSREFYRLTKPGIVYGNTLHVVAGVLLAASSHWSWLPALGVTVGTALLIASACVANNILDRPYDKRMKRTKTRPVPSGAISTKHASWFASLLLIVGMVILFTTTNILTVILGVIAYVSYAFIYTYSKRYTTWNTVIGTVPGALPPVAGYVALVGQLDMTAWIIFGLIVLWQLPHFYAIAVYRRDEYAHSGLKMLAEKLSPKQMRQVITSTLAGFWVMSLVAAVLVFNIVAGIVFMAIVSYWLAAATTSKEPDETVWARQQFKLSMFASLAFVLASLVDFVIRFSM